MYVKINNDSVDVYPYTYSQLMQDNPGISFPTAMPDENLVAWNVFPVAPTLKPPCDPIYQTVEETTPSKINDVWTQQWVVRSSTENEINQRIAAIQQEIINKTQERLDNFARTRNYDGILSACTYHNSPSPKFQQEGQYCVDMRSLTWTTLYQILDDVQNNSRPLPLSYQEIEAELPQLVWPN